MNTPLCNPAFRILPCLDEEYHFLGYVGAVGFFLGSLCLAMCIRFSKSKILLKTDCCLTAAHFCGGILSIVDMTGQMDLLRTIGIAGVFTFNLCGSCVMLQAVGRVVPASIKLQDTFAVRFIKKLQSQYFFYGSCAFVVLGVWLPFLSLLSETGEPDFHAFEKIANYLAMTYFTVITTSGFTLIFACYYAKITLLEVAECFLERTSFQVNTYTPAQSSPSSKPSESSSATKAGTASTSATFSKNKEMKSVFGEETFEIRMATLMFTSRMFAIFNLVACSVTMNYLIVYNINGGFDKNNAWYVLIFVRVVSGIYAGLAAILRVFFVRGDRWARLLVAWDDRDYNKLKDRYTPVQSKTSAAI